MGSYSKERKPQLQAADPLCQHSYPFDWLETEGPFIHFKEKREFCLYIVKDLPNGHKDVRSSTEVATNGY